MNRKMTTNSQLLTTQKKKKLSKQLEQEQNHRNGDHMERYQQGWGRIGGKVQGIRRVAGMYKIDRGRLRIEQKMEKPKNFHVRPMDMN